MGKIADELRELSDELDDSPRADCHCNTAYPAMRLDELADLIEPVEALAVPEGANVNVRWPSNDGKLIFIVSKDRDEPDFGWAAYRNTPRFTTKKRGRCGSLEEAIAAAEAEGKTEQE